MACIDSKPKHLWRQMRNLFFRLFFILFFLIKLEIYAQVAAPSLITLRVQENPSVIYWKNEGIYFGLLNFETKN